MLGQTRPKAHLYFCLVGFLLLTFLSHTDHIFFREGHCLGLAAAQNIPFFRKPGPNPAVVADEKQVVANLQALSSTDPKTSADERSQKGTKQKQVRLSKGKGFEDLPGNSVAEEAVRPDTKEREGKKKAKKSKKNKAKKEKEATRHVEDIIHEHDHADNDAYDDIVWYDGPHRDDEDEHGHDDEHGYEHGYEHDYDDHIDVEEDDNHHHDYEEEEADELGQDGVPTRAQHPVEIKPEVLANLKNIGGVNPRFAEAKAGSKSESEAKRSGAGSGSPAADQGSLSFTQQNINNNHRHQGGAEVFHHSGADILEGTISPQEFCLRLKHECESTCREFRSQIVHLPTTCADGSMAELLLWGKCCQLGQIHRTHKLTTTRQAELAEHHVRWQQKRHLAQQELDQQNPH
ncbi:hypothetical protein BGZ67_000666 [Mortierella alpina]|nr:hypothetical protein BGZ67_000666 [Mortierella alpina]